MSKEWWLEIGNKSIEIFGEGEQSPFPPGLPLKVRKAMDAINRGTEQKAYDAQEIENIYTQLTEIKHQDGTPVFDVSIEPGLRGCYIKLANQDTVANLYFRIELITLC